VDIYYEITQKKKKKNRRRRKRTNKMRVRDKNSIRNG